MTAIRKNASGTWTARPRIGGVQLRITASTKREVERRINQCRDQHERRLLGLPEPQRQPERITYDALCDLVLAQYGKREQSRNALSWNLARSRQRFGVTLVHELLADEISAWLRTLQTEKRGPKSKPRDASETTKRNTLKAMRYVLARAVKLGYVTTNIAADVEMPSEPNYDARPFESWDEVRAVASAMTTDQDAAVVLWACATGMRPSEWRALAWRDINRTASVARISRTVQNGRIVENVGKTKNAIRPVRLDDTALAALDLLPTPMRRDQLVFPDPKNPSEPLNMDAWRRGPWTRALRAAGIPYREPYGCRDTFATLGLSDGAPLEWISAQMGHGDINVTRRHYARWLPDADDRILAALNTRRAETVTKPCRSKGASA